MYASLLHLLQDFTKAAGTSRSINSALDGVQHVQRFYEVDWLVNIHIYICTFLCIYECIYKYM